MSTLKRAVFLLWLAILAFTSSRAGSEPSTSASGGSRVTSPPVYHRGLAAHYFKDPDQWNGQWPQTSNIPYDDPNAWTFTEYRYSRREPLINHFFIRQGWFSIRWVGWFDPAPGAHAGGTQEYVFEIWADDGARLFLNGETLIDDWNPRWEEAPESWRRSRPVRLAPGKHRLVVEYFQGLSEEHDDRDPMKLFWSSPSRGFKRQIIPASHFYHTDEDLRQATRPSR